MTNVVARAVALAIALFISSHAVAEWYDGGTLHNANGVQWQSASYDNKLATSADLIASLYRVKRLSPEIMSRIRTPNDFRPLSERLVAELDDAFEAEPDQEANRRMFQNQKVNDTAAMVMLMSGWIQ